MRSAGRHAKLITAFFGPGATSFKCRRLPLLRPGSHLTQSGAVVFFFFILVKNKTLKVHLDHIIRLLDFLSNELDFLPFWVFFQLNVSVIYLVETFSLVSFEGR